MEAACEMPRFYVILIDGGTFQTMKTILIELKKQKSNVPVGATAFAWINYMQQSEKVKELWTGIFSSTGENAPWLDCVLCPEGFAILRLAGPHMKDNMEIQLLKAPLPCGCVDFGMGMIYAKLKLVYQTQDGSNEHRTIAVTWLPAMMTRDIPRHMALSDKSMQAALGLLASFCAMIDTGRTSVDEALSIFSTRVHGFVAIMDARDAVGDCMSIHTWHACGKLQATQGAFKTGKFDPLGPGTIQCAPACYEIKAERRWVHFPACHRLDFLAEHGFGKRADPEGRSRGPSPGPSSEVPAAGKQTHPEGPELENEARAGECEVGILQNGVLPEKCIGSTQKQSSRSGVEPVVLRVVRDGTPHMQGKDDSNEEKAQELARELQISKEIAIANQLAAEAKRERKEKEGKFTCGSCDILPRGPGNASREEYTTASESSSSRRKEKQRNRRQSGMEKRQSRDNDRRQQELQELTRFRKLSANAAPVSCDESTGRLEKLPSVIRLKNMLRNMERSTSRFDQRERETEILTAIFNWGHR